MVLINEWLPNPIGSDADGEWIELWNGGEAAVNLRGWSLKTASGKKFVLGNREIGENDYLLLRRSESKLTLKNQDGAVILYDEAGRLAHEASFLGSAPEGKSISRVGEDFIFSEPTPGKANNINLAASAVHGAYPLSQPLNPGLSRLSFLELLIGSSLIIAAFVIVILKKNENLSQLFFGRDESARSLAQPQPPP